MTPRALIEFAWQPSPSLVPPCLCLPGVPCILAAAPPLALPPLLTLCRWPISWARLNDARRERRTTSWWNRWRTWLRAHHWTTTLCNEGGLWLRLELRPCWVFCACCAASKLLHLCIHARQVSLAQIRCRRLPICRLTSSSAMIILRSLRWRCDALRQPRPCIHL